MSIQPLNPASSDENLSQPNQSAGGQTEQPDISNLMKALEAERENRKRLESELKTRTAKEKEVQDTLERYKQVDPARYEQLLKAEQEREEQELLRKKNFEELKTRYQSETEAARKQADEWKGKHQETVIENAIKTSFFENNGKKNTIDLESQNLEDVPPVEAILNLLRPRIRLEDNKIIITNKYGEVEVNSEGRAKTLTEKMLELRKGSMGALFDRENYAAGGGMAPTVISPNGQRVKVFSREQAKNGKANIDELASGKAFVQ